MKLPWTQDKVEVRQDAPVENRHESDLILAALIARGGASGGRSLANVQATAALESAAGLTGRSFASADVDGAGDVHQGNHAGPAGHHRQRTDQRRGELVCLIDTSDGLALWPAQSYDVDGPPDPRRFGGIELPSAGLRTPGLKSTCPRAAFCISGTALTRPSPGGAVAPLSIAADSGRLSS